MPLRMRARKLRRRRNLTLVTVMKEGPSSNLKAMSLMMTYSRSPFGSYLGPMVILSSS
jgi:hypothetical protein